jgi:partitioning defective protein 6
MERDLPMMAKLEIKSKVRDTGNDLLVYNCYTLHVILQFDAEFRRISLPKTDVGTYEHFRILIERLHKLIEVPFVLSYTDPKDGDLLPINNDDNLGRAVLTAKPLLRIIVQRKGKI